MGLDRCGAEERKPNKQLGEPSKEEEVSDVEDVDDNDDEDDTDDEVVEIPDDPVMEARRAALKAEQALLEARAEQEEANRAVVFGEAEEWKRYVEALQASLTCAKALIKEREGLTIEHGKDGGCKPPGPNGHEKDEGDDDKGKSHSQVEPQN